jgi:hypothetical protein
MVREQEAQEQAGREVTARMARESWSMATLTIRVCAATVILLVTFMVMHLILNSGRQLQESNLIKVFCSLIVLNIPLLMNVYAAQWLKQRHVASVLLLLLTCVGCGWHLFFFSIFTMESLKTGVMHMHGLAGVLEFLTLCVHFIVSAAFALWAMGTNRGRDSSLPVSSLRQDILTSRPIHCVGVCGGTVLVLCLIATNASRFFLRPEFSASFDTCYTVSALSDDSRILAVGAAGQYEQGRAGTRLTLLDTETLIPIVEPIWVPRCIHQLEFVSPEFGFLGVLIDEEKSHVTEDADSKSPSLLWFTADGSAQAIECTLPGNISWLKISSNDEVAAVGSIDQARHEGTCHFIRLVDGSEISSVTLTDVGLFEAHFTTDNKSLLVMTAPPDSHQKDHKSVLLIDTDRGSVENIFKIDTESVWQTNLEAVPGSGVYEFVSGGKLIRVWLTGGKWRYFISNGIAGPYINSSLCRIASDRIVACDSYDGSHGGSSIRFFEGTPPRLLDRKIESDCWTSDMELTADGNRIFLLEGNRISTYLFPVRSTLHSPGRN